MTRDHDSITAEKGGVGKVGVVRCGVHGVGTLRGSVHGVKFCARCHAATTLDRSSKQFQTPHRREFCQRRFSPPLAG